jgi:hypothetical protein
MTNEEFQKLVASKVPEGPFRPMAVYDPDDDIIEILTSNENYRVERIDSLVTVYYGRESQEIVGSLIKGVSRLLKASSGQIPNIRLEIHDGRIKVVHLFRAARRLSEPKRPTVVLVYEKLEQVAEENGLEANISGLAESCA